MFFATFYIKHSIICFFILLPIYFNLTNYGCCTDAFLGKASVGQALNF